MGTNSNRGDRIYKIDNFNKIVKKWIFNNKINRFVDRTQYASKTIPIDLGESYEYELSKINECEALMYLL